MLMNNNMNEVGLTKLLRSIAGWQQTVPRLVCPPCLVCFSMLGKFCLGEFFGGRKYFDARGIFVLVCSLRLFLRPCSIITTK